MVMFLCLSLSTFQVIFCKITWNNNGKRIAIPIVLPKRNQLQVVFIWKFFFFFLFWLIDLNDNAIFSTGSFSEWWQQPRLGHAEARSLELQLLPACERQKPECLGRYLQPPWLVVSGELYGKHKAGISGGTLTCCVTMLIVFFVVCWS